MAFYKTSTKTYANTTAGKAELFSWWVTLLTTRGWNLTWQTAAGDDTFYALSRTVTYTDGTTLPYSLIYESEPTASDLNQYAWNGSDSYASFNQDPRNLNSSSSWRPFVNNGEVSFWEDDASDAYLFLFQNRVMSLQLPDGGFINNGLNDQAYGLAGTRPYYAILPISMDQDGKGTVLNNDYAEYLGNAVTPYKPEVARPGIWTDYCAFSYGSGSDYPTYKIWEDQSGTWKMWSEKYQRDFTQSGVEVVKVGSEYYLNLGQFLLPAGTLEPEL